jgi:hypothetical protein
MKKIFITLISVLLYTQVYAGWSEATRDTSGCSVTLDTVTVRVRELLDDSYTATNTVRYSSATIYSLINTAQRIVAINTLCIETYATQTLTAGTTEYLLPSNCLAVSRVTMNSFDTNGNMYLPQKTVFGMDYDAKTWDVSRSTPTAYFLRNRYMGFYPAPKYGTAKVTLWYYKIPTIMTTGSSFVYDGNVLLETYWETLAIYAAYKLYLGEGRTDMTAQLAPEFSGSISAIQNYIKINPDLNLNLQGKSFR